MRMHWSMGVRGVDVAVRIEVYGLIVRMHRRKALLERHLMLAADAMLQRPREHALERQCKGENPNQEKAGKSTHEASNVFLSRNGCRA
jgi:hypothetical protein